MSGSHLHTYGKDFDDDDFDEIPEIDPPKPTQAPKGLSRSDYKSLFLSEKEFFTLKRHWEEEGRRRYMYGTELDAHIKSVKTTAEDALRAKIVKDLAAAGFGSASKWLTR